MNILHAALCSALDVMIYLQAVSQLNFFRGLSLLILLNAIVKPVWIFFVDRQVQNLSGHEVYGSYFSIFSLSIVLSFIADAGISNMMNRQLALSLPAGVNQLFQYKVLLSAIFLFIFFLVCWLSGLHQWKLIILVGLIQVMSSFVVFFRSVITASQKFSTDSWISVLDKLLVVIFMLPFLYLFSKKGEDLLYFFLYIQAGSLFITLVLSGIQAGKSMNDENEKKVAFNQLLKLTLPFVILIALMGIHSRLDMFLLERLHADGAKEAGVYAASYRLLDAANMIGYLSASFLVPFVARHLKDKTAISAVINRLRHALLNFSITAAVFCIFFAGWVISSLYHTADPYYQQILALCLLSLPAYMMIHVYGSLLTASGEFRSFMQIVLIAAVLNVLINCFFIPKFGALACVYAALLSQYLLAGLCYFTAVKKLRLRYATRQFLLNLFYAILLCAAFYLMAQNGSRIGTVILVAGLLSSFTMFVQNKLLKQSR